MEILASSVHTFCNFIWSFFYARFLRTEPPVPNTNLTQINNTLAFKPSWYVWSISLKLSVNTIYERNTMALQIDKTRWVYTKLCYGLWGCMGYVKITDILENMVLYCHYSIALFSLFDITLWISRNIIFTSELSNKISQFRKNIYVDLTSVAIFIYI